MDINDKEMEDDWDGQAIPLLNATTFAAVYLNRRKDSVGTLYYAIHSLTAGVEEPYQTPDQYRDAAMYVPPAVTWILLAGKWIYELCTHDMNCEDGASLQQWAFWKKRFGEIAKTQGLQGEIKDHAWRAAFKMGEIESQIE
ncbi:hypothetical protein MMC22_002016 [Lobaria immixta]|nr:hypothetical protein [Lobaria immixta]